YGEALFMNSKLIGGVTEFLNTERELNEVNTERLMWFCCPARIFFTINILINFKIKYGFPQR
ncbi:hypothetical protein GOODEAATRI_029037, partial [Goodea atripinnis]